MNRKIITFACGAALLLTTVCSAAQIQGEYLESRSCDVYTGPCFANAEMDLAGKEAIMAWRVETGSWKGVDLAGLSVAVVANSQQTMGDTGVFRMKAGAIRSVVLIDENATAAQEAALIDFVKSTATEFTHDLGATVRAPMSLENDHLAGRGKFQAGDIAQIETRGLKHGDCVCSNETVFYQPLTKIENAHPAYSRTLSYTGDGLPVKFTNHNQRSAFLGTFRR